MSTFQSCLGTLACLLFAILISGLGPQGFDLISSGFFYLACLSFIIHWLGFLPAYYFRTEKTFDLTGSITHCSVIVTAWFMQSQANLRSNLLLICVLIWALRLGLFLWARVHQDGKDDRFDRMKNHFFWFLMTWTLSGLWVFVTQAPVLLALLTNPATSFNHWDALGFGLWALGFGIEVIADWQKRRFKTLPSPNKPFIDTGLWALCRHPNYFGEILLWCGLSLSAAQTLALWQSPVLLSPLLLAYLLINISGINMLRAKADKRWGNRSDYQAYLANTPMLIPWLW